MAVNTSKNSITVTLPKFKDKERLDTVTDDMTNVGIANEREYVSYEELRQFFIYELELDYSWDQKLDQLFDVILLRG